MLYRVLPLLLVALAVALLSGTPVLAADKPSTHEVTIVKAGDGQLTVSGKSNKPHTHAVAKDAVVTCNGTACKLADLKPGVKATVTVSGKGDKAQFTKIEAHVEKAPKK
jgi:hypothetical protein